MSKTPKFNVDQEACCPLCGEPLDSSVSVIIPQLYNIGYSDEQNWSKRNNDLISPPSYLKFSRKRYNDHIPHNPIHEECWDKAMKILRGLMFPDKQS